MEELKRSLKERRKYLLKLKTEKNKAIKNGVKGKLRISCHGKRIQYYWRSGPKDVNGTYLKDIYVAQKLAQKEYDTQIIRLAEKEIVVIDKFLGNYPKINSEEYYTTLHPERRKLLNPIIETEEQFVERWRSFNFKGKDFSQEIPELYSARGERVRSKSELIIADFLEREGIPYRYECPLYLNGFGNIYPDFTVLNVRTRKEMYWEHFGMMDNPTYAEKAIQKIATYEKNQYFQGERLIFTYETQNIPLNQKTLKMLVEHYLK